MTNQIKYVIINTESERKREVIKMFIATILDTRNNAQSTHKFPTEKSIYCFIEMMNENGIFLMLLDITKA